MKKSFFALLALVLFVFCQTAAAQDAPPANTFNPFAFETRNVGGGSGGATGSGATATGGSGGRRYTGGATGGSGGSDNKPPAGLTCGAWEAVDGGKPVDKTPEECVAAICDTRITAAKSSGTSGGQLPLYLCGALLLGLIGLGVLGRRELKKTQADAALAARVALQLLDEREGGGPKPPG